VGPAVPDLRAHLQERDVAHDAGIGRERSCANFHSDPPTGSTLAFSLAGHVSLYTDQDTPPPPSNNCPVNPVLAP
jgi:hypothetical protein